MMPKKSKQGDPDVRNGLEFPDGLKAAPDRYKQGRHLEQMLVIYRESRQLRNTDPVQLDDGDLDIWAAASSDNTGHPQKCPLCGAALPPDGFEEHQRLKHTDYR